MIPAHDALVSRLWTWKFESARRLLDDDLHLDKAQMAWVRDTVTALADLVGNSGWFEGALGVIVNVVVERLLTTLGWHGDGPTAAPPVSGATQDTGA